MQKEITVNEIAETLNKYSNIEEPIIVKRENNNDLVIISFEEYKKKIFLSELRKKIDEGEEDISNSNMREAREVFGELKQKYGY